MAVVLSATFLRGVRSCPPFVQGFHDLGVLVDLQLFLKTKEVELVAKKSSFFIFIK